MIHFFGPVEDIGDYWISTGEPPADPIGINLVVAVEMPLFRLGVPVMVNRVIDIPMPAVLLNSGIRLDRTIAVPGAPAVLGPYADIPGDNTYMPIVTFVLATNETTNKQFAVPMPSASVGTSTK